MSMKKIMSGALLVLVIFIALYVKGYISLPLSVVQSISTEPAAEVHKDVTAVSDEQNQLITDLDTVEKVDALSDNKQPRVVKFYAEWCGACTVVAAYYTDLAQQFKDKVSFYSVNIDNQEIMAKLDAAHIAKQPVDLLPTLILSQKDGAYEVIVGAKEKEECVGIIKKTFSL